MLVSLVLAGADDALAQSIEKVPTESSALDEQARELFRSGVKAAEKSQWARAHAAFLAAWSLKEHYQIAGNLGTSEAMLGKWREAATHLAYYLREAPKEKVAERRSAQKLLEQARAKVGALAVRVEPAGAEILIDGKSVGRAPLAGEVFVEPGVRVLEARLTGYEVAKQEVSAAAGASLEVPLRLVAMGASTKVVTGAAGAPTGASAPSQGSASPAATTTMSPSGERKQGPGASGPTIAAQQPAPVEEAKGPSKGG